MARQLKCSVCGNEFTYNKRGRTPRHPVCSSCTEATAVKEANVIAQDVADNETKAPAPKTKGTVGSATVSNRYTTYYEFTEPSEESKPFEPGEELYFVPRGIFHTEDSLHRYGRVCKFVRYAEDEAPGRVYVEVAYRRERKSVPEILWTSKSNLTRFRRIRRPVDEPGDFVVS